LLIDILALCRIQCKSKIKKKSRVNYSLLRLGCASYLKSTSQWVEGPGRTRK